MANLNLDIVIKAHDQATAVFNRAQSSAEKFGARIQASVSGFVNFRSAAIAGAAALAGFTYAMVTSIKAAGEAEAAEKKLAVALGYTSEALLEQAGALQRVTTFGDDQIVGAQALIAAFTKDESHIKSLTKATLDLASAKGMDLSSAAELVGKTFGTSTNAMARQGIVVDATAGSAERLSQILNGLSRYSGQAEGAAQTFDGRLLQLKNTFGDLQEEIGFVITKNEFFIKAVEIVNNSFARMAERVKANRLELMELARGAMIRVIQSIGYAVRAVEAFHDGWFGLRLVAQAVLLAMVDTVNVLYNALRLLLNPLDVIYEGMVKLGLAESNPFSNWQDSINEFRGSVVSSGAELLDKIDATKVGYGAIKAEISGIVTEMQKWAASPAGIVPTAVQAATVNNAGGVSGDKTVKSAALVEPQQDAHILAYQRELDFQALIETTYTGHYSKLVDLHKQYGKDITTQEIFKARTIEYLASNTFGMMSSMMQNLTVLAGKEGGAAFKAMKAFAIAETLIQTYRAAMGSYAALAPIPIIGPALGVAAAAAAVVAGLARVKQISSMEPGGSATGATVSAGGSASPSYSGGSTSAYPSPQRAEEKPTQNVTIIINSPLADQNWDKITQDNIIPAINAAGDRNVKISLNAVEAA